MSNLQKYNRKLSCNNRENWKRKRLGKNARNDIPDQTNLLNIDEIMRLQSRTTPPAQQNGGIVDFVIQYSIYVIRFHAERMDFFSTHSFAELLKSSTIQQRKISNDKATEPIY